MGAWLVLVFTASSSALADRAAGIRYALPGGWQASDQRGVRALVPSDLPPGGLMMALVMGVEPAAGSPAQQLAELAAAINADAKVTSSSEVVTTDRGAVGKIHVQNFAVESPDIGPHNRMIVVLVRGNRRAAVLFLIRDQATMQKYGAAVQRVIQSLDLDPDAPGRPTSPPAPAPAPAAAGAAGSLPTGDTPALYPGTPGWLPSGRGVAIPAARVVDGRPQGMWWHPQVQGSRTVAITTIFLADGTRATGPRPGGATLFDLEGQKRAPGTTGVGTFTVTGGKITEVHDGFTDTRPFRSGSDKDGPWLEIGAARHRPLAPVTAKGLVGTWRAPGGSYVFRADGTYESGHITSTGAWMVAAGGRGTWQVDGYLLAIRPHDAPGWINRIGATGRSFVVIGPVVYNRE